MSEMFTIFIQAPLLSQVLTVLALYLWVRCQQNK